MADDQEADKETLNAALVALAAANVFGHGHDLANDGQHSHTHTLSASNPISAATLIPKSRVVDWIGYDASLLDLSGFPVGTILGYTGNATALAVLTSEWEICDGTGGKPNLVDKFATVGSATGGTTHQHAQNSSSSDSAGGHNHGGAATGDATPGQDQSGAAGNPFGMTNGDHTHDINTSSGHTHDTTVTWDSKNNLPPYYTLLYAIRVSGTVSQPAGPPSSLYCFFEYGTATPDGWTLQDSTFDGRIVVGYKSGDANFGSYGNTGSDTHTHTENSYLSWASAGSHSHAQTTTGENSGSFVDVGGNPPTAVSLQDHDHAFAAGPHGAHTHSANLTTDSKNHKPDSTRVSVISKD
jgi:hypothetical protein